MPTIKRQFEGLFQRAGAFDASSVDLEARTVALSFSSEVAALMPHGREILDHSDGAVQLERLRAGAPLLLEHDRERVIGVVLEASVENRRGRALVKFAESAADILRDVRDGIRRNVSMGYLVHKAVETAGGVLRATLWEPFEISLVSIPVDFSVGVGRAFNNWTMEVTTMPKPTNPGNDAPETTTTTTTTPPSANQRSADPPASSAYQVELIEAERERAAAAERERCSHISLLGDRHNAPELAANFIRAGRSVEEFKRALTDHRGRQAQPYSGPSADAAAIGMSEREVRSFSFVRAINALANPNDVRAQRAAAFEFECSAAACEASGVETRGIRVPTDAAWLPPRVQRALGQYSRELSVFRLPADVVSHRFSQRAQNVTTPTAGGHLVATDLLAESFIDVLRANLLLDSLGATVLTDLVGDVAIPRKDTGSTVGWISTEGGDAAETSVVLGQVTMTPKTLGAWIDATRRLLLQSSMDVEAMLRNDLAVSMALEISRAGLYGSGASGQPTGVENTAGINTLDLATDEQPTWAEIVTMEGLVEADNALMGRLAYATNPTIKANMKTKSKDTGSGQFLWERGNEVNGYPAFSSSQVEQGDVWFGNWADLLIGFWSGVDLLVDPYTNSKSGTVRVVALQSCDVAVRHAVSFCKANSDVA